MYNTVSLEVAKQLKEAGWKRVGIFVYNNLEKNEVYDGAFIYKTVDYKLTEVRDCTLLHDDILYAPQLHEILEELPTKVLSNGYGYSLNVVKIYDDSYMASYADSSGVVFNESYQKSKNPHDAAALLWVWCVENGYITLPNKDT